MVWAVGDCLIQSSSCGLHGSAADSLAEDEIVFFLFFIYFFIFYLFLFFYFLFFFYILFRFNSFCSFLWETNGEAPLAAAR